MSSHAERKTKSNFPKSERKELYQALPVIWGEVNRMITNPSYAREFSQELHGWWQEIFRRSIYRGIGISTHIKKRQLIDTPDTRKWDEVAPSRASSPILSFEQDTENGLSLYILDQRAQRGLYDRVIFCVDSENKIKGLRKVVASRTSKSISENGTKPMSPQVIQSAEIDFYPGELRVRLKNGEQIKTVQGPI